jgi:hypothetical protein
VRDGPLPVKAAGLHSARAASRVVRGKIAGCFCVQKPCARRSAVRVSHVQRRPRRRVRRASLAARSAAAR